MRIFTSRYQNQKAIIESGAVAVGITVGRPRFRLRYPVTYYRQIAPTGPLFHVQELEQFEPAYRAKLEQIGIDAMLDAFKKISEANGGRDIVLLCFEDVRREGQWCHRRILAQLWQEKTGEVVEELPG